jgi:hypothetical protein
VPAIAAEIHHEDKASQITLERAEYANDLDRLEKLTGRIDRACRSSYLVVLGAGDSSISGGLVSVDYALFDRLSDDGAAVLIAEAIAAGPKLSSPSQMQAQGGVERAVLQADEAVGRYVARAGFSSSGFTEWLKAQKLSAFGMQQSGVSEKMRISAFMRGYTSEIYNKER